jgi:DNA-directed RNA polymerase subunit alpha
MYYDEDQARRIAKRNAVLDIPVTDFELSVRARNCLKKMNIMTLGDLVRTSESELLGYKNFGETSLKEIKDMLSAKGLRLGQESESAGELSGLFGDVEESEDEADGGARALTIEQVEFSVRARRVLEQLNIHTLGELASKTEAELLGQKNFGQTSLSEMRQRLTENGLHFREIN